MNELKRVTMKKTCVLIITIFVLNIAKAQLIVTPAIGTTLQEQLLQNMLGGAGTVVSNITFKGVGGGIVWNNIGTFTTGSSPTNLGITKGLILGSGGVTGAVGPNNSSSFTMAVIPTTPDSSDSDLVALVPGAVLHDAAVLEFDFKIMTDTFKVRYVLGSEEYPEFVNSTFNDVFGFFVSGANPSGGTYNKMNIALVPATNMPVTIDNINNTVNSAYYVDNTGGAILQADGFTTVLTAWCLVVPCETYHFKIAIADRGDRSYDSWVWLEALPTVIGSGNFSGATKVCEEESVLYSIPSISYFTQYNWSLPNGATGSSDSNSIVVNYGNNALSGFITVSGVSLCGIDTITSFLVVVNQKPPAPTITLSGDTLFSTALTGNQWYNQDGLLVGDTNQYFIATSTGDYWDVVTLNTCPSDSSNVIHYDYMGIKVYDNKGIYVYPNPTKDNITIETNSTNEQKLEILNLIGQTVYTSVITKKAVVKTSAFPVGVYFIKLSTDKETVVKKFVKV